MLCARKPTVTEIINSFVAVVPFFFFVPICCKYAVLWVFQIVDITGFEIAESVTRVNSAKDVSHHHSKPFLGI